MKHPDPNWLRSRDLDLAAARKLNLFSNLFMSVALKDIPACQYCLRILTGIKDLAVLDVRSQERFSNIESRDAILDIVAEDTKGRKYNIEIQRADALDHKRRIRLYRAEMDSSILQKGTAVDALPDLYVIYLSETDICGSGLAWDKVVQSFDRSKGSYDDGCHVIFANAEVVEDNDEISRLMQYFLTADPDDDSHGELSKRIHFLKSEKGGEAIIMNEIENSIYTNGERHAKLDDILSIMSELDFTVERAMEVLHIIPEERPIYAAYVKAALEGQPA